MTTQRILIGVSVAFLSVVARAADCNANGIDDAVEIQANPQLDCDGDGLLNVCELALVANDDVVHIGYGFAGSAFVTGNDIVGNGNTLTVGIEITSNPVQGFLPHWGFGEIYYNHSSPNLARDCSPSTDIVRYRLVDCAGNVSNIATLTVRVDHPIPDCNCNWKYDYDETFNGEALDNNGNGVPDECEGPPGPCRIVLVDPSSPGSQNFPDLSADGRYLVYSVQNFSGTSIRFLDRQTGASEQVVQSSPFGFGSGDKASVSDDGRYVAFHGSSSALVAGDTNNWSDVFVRDRTLATTRRISVTSSWGQANGPSTAPSISADGRWVAFETTATNITGVSNRSRIYLFDLLAVPPANPLLAVIDSNGSAPDESSFEPAVSADGRYVAFASWARNLIPGSTDPDWTGDVFRFDRLGAPGTMMQRVSLGLGGALANSDSFGPSISATGQKIAFVSYATNLVSPDVGGFEDAFVRDMSTGTTQLVSTGANGQANAFVARARIDSSGNRVGFTTSATNLLPSGSSSNFVLHMHVRDLVASTTEMYSLGDLGSPANGDSGYDGFDLVGTGSPVFQSWATNLVLPTQGAYLYSRTCAATIDADVCVGDGSLSECPCGNNSALGSGRGCLHSFGLGARLDGTGVSSVLADTLRIAVSEVPASGGQTTTFFQGTRLAGGGAGTVFGDGLRCAVGTVLRLGTRSAASGGASFGHGIGGDPAISFQGAIPATGSTRYYQATYRNALSFCTSATFNTSNGVEVVWVP